MKWAIIIFLSLLMISLVSSAPPLSTTSGEKYTPTSDLTFSKDNKTANLITYYGIRNIYEDGVWKRIEDAKSLKTIYSFNTIPDANYPLTIVDYNLTTVNLCVQSRTRESIIPLQVYHYEQTNTGKYIEGNISAQNCLRTARQLTDCVPAETKIIDSEYLVSMLAPTLCFNVDVNNLKGKTIKWGSTSTTVKLIDVAGTGDGFLYNTEITWIATREGLLGDAGSSNSSTTATVGAGSGNYGGFLWSEIWRGFFPINTSSVGNARIVQALFVVNVTTVNTPSGKTNVLRLVTTTQNNTAILQLDDYDNCSQLNNPESLVDLAITTTGINIFRVNEDDFMFINKTGFTKFGLRDVTYDANNETPPSFGLNPRNVIFTTSESTTPPYLNVTYELTPFVNMISPYDKNMTVNFSNVVFNFSVIASKDDIKNATLYSDYNGTWSAVDFKVLDWKGGTTNYTTFTRNIMNDLSYTNLSYLDDSFKWGVLVRTNKSEGYWGGSGEYYHSFAWGSKNFTFSNFGLNATLTNVTGYDTLRLSNPEISSSWVNTNGLMLLYHYDKKEEYNETDYNVYDWSGNGNNGSVNGFPLWNETGKFGNYGSFQFSGINDYIVTNNSKLKINNNFTIMTWTRFDNLEGIQTMVYHGLNSIYFNYWLLLDAGKILKIVYWGNGFNYGVTSYNVSNLNSNQWYFLATTFNSQTKNLTLWINGTVINSTIAPSNPNSTASNKFHIGSINSLPTSYFLNGTVEETAIWNRTLSDTEVFNIYNKTRFSYEFGGSYESKIFSNSTAVNWSSIYYSYTKSGVQNFTLYQRTTNSSTCSNGWGGYTLVTSDPTIQTLNATCWQYKLLLESPYSTVLGTQSGTPYLSYMLVNYSAMALGEGCSCPPEGQNWVIPESCILSTNCNLVLGNFSITGGDFTLNSGANLTCNAFSLTKGARFIMNKGSRIIIKK